MRRSTSLQSGRPGPVLVDMTKDVFQAQAHYTPVTEIHLPGLQSFHRRPWRTDPARGADDVGSRAAVRLCGRRNRRRRTHSDELRELVEALDAPAVCTLMGLGGLPGESSELHQHAWHARQLRGQYGHVPHADLLIALGVRFDDRVTGRLAAFAPHAQGDSRGYRPGGNRQEPPRRICRSWATSSACCRN